MIEIQSLRKKHVSYMAAARRLALAHSESITGHDQELWSRLPPELLERILKRLPTSSLLRFRCVCKRWKSLLSSPSFDGCPDPCLVLFDPSPEGSVVAYAASSRSWLKMPSGFLYTAKDRIWKPVCSASGKVLYVSDTALPSRFPIQNRVSVCNPLTNTVVELPPFHTIKSPLAVGFAGSEGNKVVVIGNKSDFTADMIAEVYLSATDAWRVIGRLPSDFLLEHGQLLECNGSFYGLLIKYNDMLIIRTDGVKWTILALRIPYPCTFPKLVASQNSIFMVGGVDDSYEEVRIWKFRPEARNWQPFVSMPRSLRVQKLCAMFSCLLECIGVGNTICFLFGARILTYDLSHKSWNWLPDCPHELGYPMQVFQWEPCLL